MPMKCVAPISSIREKLKAYETAKELCQKVLPEVDTDRAWIVQIDAPTDRDNTGLAIVMYVDDRTEYVHIPEGNEYVAEFILRDLKKNENFVVATKREYDLLLEKCRYFKDKEERQLILKE